jgi:hypothetical protein
MESKCKRRTYLFIYATERKKNVNNDTGKFFKASDDSLVTYIDEYLFRKTKLNNYQNELTDIIEFEE